MKYIFVTGGVVSSLGKGLAAASLGTLLELRGLRVVFQKFDRKIVVGVDAADLGSSEEDGLRLDVGKKTMRRRLIAKIQFFTRCDDDFAILLFKPAHDRRADHPAMTGYVDALPL